MRNLRMAHSDPITFPPAVHHAEAGARIALEASRAVRVVTWWLSALVR
jgi:hypothetical protein